MFRLIWTLSVRTRDYLHRYMPSNRLLAGIRTRRGLKWGDTRDAGRASVHPDRQRLLWRGS